jgi:F420-non-reducing hydrogenase small subunit
MSKPKVAFYWCASCGGCEEAIVDLNEGLLDVVAAVDIAFWPVAIDTKYADIEAMEDGAIDVTFINGAIRMDDQEHAVKLLRRKSKVLIAFGSCAHLGGIPGLSNLTNRAETLARAYLEVPSMDNPDGIMPQLSTQANGVELTLPGFWETVRRLDEVADVDYFLPGCPPQPDTISAALQAILTGDLPPRKSVLAPGKNLCAECSRQATKPERLHIDAVKRIHQVMVEPDECFLSKGVVCLGLATRSGCGEKCMTANMPCRGCYGPTDGVADQGAAFISAFAALLGRGDRPDLAAAVDSFVDIAGTVYRFSVPASLAHRGNLMKQKGESTP